MKIRAAGAELLRGETDMKTLMVALRTFAKAPKTTKNSVCEVQHIVCVVWIRMSAIKK
jgi:hypothetical protein